MTAPERVPFSRVDPDGGAVDGTARIDRGPDGYPVVISDLRDLDGNPLPLPDGCIFAAGGQSATAEGGDVTLARKLDPTPPADLASQRGGVDAWVTWLHDHDPESHHRLGYPDPVGERAAANVDRERNR